MQTGQFQQGLNQQQLNDQINRYNYYQTLPYQQLNQYLSSVGGNYGGTTTGSTSSPYYINQGANALSGALGVGSLANMAIPGGLSSLFGGGAGAAFAPFAAGGALGPAATAGGGLASIIGSGASLLPFLV
jgi:hypothetical protein